MKLPRVTLCVALVATAVIAAERSTPAVGEAPGASLTALFDLSRGLARDTNGDGIADRIAARVVVPAVPTAGDMDAATNIAGRLGFETSEAVLPVLMRDSETLTADILPIFVGRDNVHVAALAGRGAIDLKSLTAGQGLVALVESPVGGGMAVVIAGADNEGTIAAGAEFGARLPRLWGMTGITIGAIEQQIALFLRAQRVTAQAPAITALIVDKDRRGIAQVVARVPVAAAEGARALAAFEQLDLAHRRGREPRTLNFANAAEVVVDVVAGGTVAGRGRVSRAGLNSRTLTPPIDPDELATDSPWRARGDRRRHARAGQDVRPDQSLFDRRVVR